MSQFTPEFFQFLRQLKRHNDREWFTANKERYLSDVQAPALEFVTRVEAGLRKISTHLVADHRPSGGSMFRIYRDTRFSKDKSPYKTAVGIRFPHRSARDMHAPGLYLNLEPGNVFVASGIRQLDSKSATKIREEIIERPAAWNKAVRTPPFSPGFELAGETLTRPPRGVDPRHPLIDDLKRKDFIGVQTLDEKTVTSDGFVQAFLSISGDSVPLLRFLCAALALPI